MLLLLLLAAQAAISPTPPAPATTIATAAAPAATKWPTKEADAILRGFRFHTGETLDLRLHYTTLGSPHRNARGEIDNAVMVLHGTGGTGKQFLQPQFADRLYGPGQPLDTAKYWIILPDNIGHGASSKPSDGLRMKFPKYDYDDMVAAQHRLLTETLGVKRMRLIMGTSMGCMHIFVLGETYPDFAAALMPLACEPVEVAGLNRMWRQLVIDGIEQDPAWRGGDYTAEPQQGLRTAASLLFVAGGAPLWLQAQFPTREAATTYARERVAAAIKGVDASRTYNPWAKLEAITAPTAWINSADDFINPRGLTYPAGAVKRMKDATFRLIPETAETHGHGTHTWAVNWEADLRALLARTEPNAVRPE